MDPTTRSQPEARPPTGEDDPLAARPEDRPAAPAEEESGWGRTPRYQLAGPLRYVALVENAVIFALHGRNVG